MPVVITQTPLSVHLTSGYCADNPGTRTECRIGSLSSQGAASGPNSVITITLTARGGAGLAVAAGACGAAAARSMAVAQAIARRKHVEWFKWDPLGASGALCAGEPAPMQGPSQDMEIDCLFACHLNFDLQPLESTERIDFNNRQ
ncbi:MAG: hypothetical protein ACJ8G1_16600 [Vitreoscilla sp.]